MILNYGASATPTTWLAFLVPIGVAFLVYYLGLLAYRRQKESELARQRYLDEGVDLVASRLEEALYAYRRNWFHGLQIIKYMRHVGTVPKALLDTSLVVIPEVSNLETRANYRLSALLRDPVFYHVQQLALAFAQNASAFIRDDLCTAATKMSEGEEMTVPHEKVAEEYFQQLNRLHEESNQHSRVIGYLQELAAFLETEQFSFKHLERFHRKPEVQAVIRAVREMYKDELEGNQDAARPPDA